MCNCSCQHVVNSTIPEWFHPKNEESKLDLKCHTTVSKLKPRKEDISVRKKVQQILQEWEASLQLSEIENHALSIPSDQAATIESLANSLTASYAKYVTSLGDNKYYLQIAKAYAIYFWVANNIHHDTAMWQAFLGGEDTVKVNAKAALRRRVTVCSGYTSIYCALATKAGLEAEEVHGHVKYWRFLSQEGPNSQFEPNRETIHDWNVVSHGRISS